MTSEKIISRYENRSLPTLLSSILGESVTSTRPMQICRYGILICNAKYILFHKQKIKVKNFIIVVALINFSDSFRFSFFSLFNVSLASLAMWRVFYYFIGGSHLSGDCCFIFKYKTLLHLRVTIDNFKFQ